MSAEEYFYDITKIRVSFETNNTLRDIALEEYKKTPPT
jgi:hypothetical protein